MSETLTQRIEQALRSIVNTRIGRDVVSAGMVHDLATTAEGRVRFTLALAAADDATLARQARIAVAQVPGVIDVRLDVVDLAQLANRPGWAGGTAQGGPHAQPAPQAHGGHGGAPRTLPVMNEAPQPRVAAPQPVPYPELGRIIAVSSGKGGVGKSTVTVNLAVALAQKGYRVGIMDADIYGPNVPKMMGVSGQPPVENEKILPLEAHGVKVISLGFLIERDQPAIWRGPIVMKIITQFLRDVNWGGLDVLLVDMPPGTGDAQLSLVQATQVHGAVVVTTPQQVATGDALRGVRMFERVGVPVVGIVENMSYFECPHCGKPTALFGSGGGEALAKEVALPLIGQIPLYPRVMQGGDEGRPIVLADAESTAAKALVGVAERVTKTMGITPATAEAR